MSASCFLRTSDLPAPGRATRVDAFGERILVVNVGGVLRAVSDTCSHEDASLSLGAVAGETIRCPLHGSRFCLKTGAALDEPAELPLTVYAVTAVEGGVEIRP